MPETSHTYKRCAGWIDLSSCGTCDAITLNAEHDRCVCGGELYPVSLLVKPGTTIAANGRLVVTDPSGKRVDLP